MNGRNGVQGGSLIRSGLPQSGAVLTRAGPTTVFISVEVFAVLPVASSSVEVTTIDGWVVVVGW